MVDHPATGSTLVAPAGIPVAVLAAGLRAAAGGILIAGQLCHAWLRAALTQRALRREHTRPRLALHGLRVAVVVLSV